MTSSDFNAYAARFLTEAEAATIRSASIGPSSGREADAAPSSVLDRHEAWDRSLRNELARLRSGYAGKDPERWIRPGAEDERKATVAALIEVFTDEQLPVQLRRDVIWMLSEVITNDEYDPAQAAEQFKNPDFRDDLRMALQRIPGDNAIAALKAGLEIVPDDFKPAIACSLRARGVEVPNVPCVKLKPTKQTKVKPVGR